MGSDGCNKPIVVFGLGSFSKLMTKYINAFTSWHIEAYTVDDTYCNTSLFLEKPVIPFSQIAAKCPPDSFDALIAVGYSSMGVVRQNAFKGMKAFGYHVRNFQHPDASCGFDSIGEGNIILERAIISIGTSIGNANLFWCNSNIAHDSTIGSFNTFCPSSAFGGFTSIADNCFFGINSTCKDNLSIASGTFVGAGAYVTRDTEENSAFIAEATRPTSRVASESIKQFLNE